MPVDELTHPDLAAPVPVHVPLVEVELKYRVTPEQSRQLWSEIARIDPAESHVQLREWDDYFRNGQGVMVRGRTTEVSGLQPLRVADLTYKGPRQPSEGGIKAREEIVVQLGDEAALPAMTLLLSRVGFSPCGRVIKHRTQFRLHHAGVAVSVCLDDVAKVGHFVELEAVTLPEARTAVDMILRDLAGRLGLSPCDQESRGYFDLVQDAEGLA